MLAAFATKVNPLYPLTGLKFGDIDEPDTPSNWVTVNVRTASVNHHDLWALRGLGLSADRLPMILGTDAAGVTDDGREVIVHALLGDPNRGHGDETCDPQRQLLSEFVPGTFAERVRVPPRNLVDKPKELSWESAACLPTAWLTAYRMLTTQGHAQPGQTLLIQGAGGGVSTAAVVLGKLLGLRVWVTSRDEAKRAWIVCLGADKSFATGASLPSPADLVIETVGAATWQHSVDSVRYGGCIVVSGATTGSMPGADLLSILAKVIRVQGSVMGTAEELGRLAQLLADSGVDPVIDRVLPLERVGEGISAMDKGELRGKVVVHV